jgi:hypothetical protein
MKIEANELTKQLSSSEARVRALEIAATPPSSLSEVSSGEPTRNRHKRTETALSPKTPTIGKRPNLRSTPSTVTTALTTEEDNNQDSDASSATYSGAAFPNIDPVSADVLDKLTLADVRNLLQQAEEAGRQRLLTQQAEEGRQRLLMQQAEEGRQRLLMQQAEEGRQLLLMQQAEEGRQLLLMKQAEEGRQRLLMQQAEEGRQLLLMKQVEEERQRREEQEASEMVRYRQQMNDEHQKMQQQRQYSNQSNPSMIDQLHRQRHITSTSFPLHTRHPPHSNPQWEAGASGGRGVTNGGSLAYADDNNYHDSYNGSVATEDHSHYYTNTEAVYHPHGLGRGRGQAYALPSSHPHSNPPSGRGRATGGGGGHSAAPRGGSGYYGEGWVAGTGGGEYYNHQNNQY